MLSITLFALVKIANTASTDEIGITFQLSACAAKNKTDTDIISMSVNRYNQLILNIQYPIGV